MLTETGSRRKIVESVIANSSEVRRSALSFQIQGLTFAVAAIIPITAGSKFSTCQGKRLLSLPNMTAPIEGRCNSCTLDG
jgi:hypothetical protein